MTKGSKTAGRRGRAKKVPAVRIEDLPPHLQRHALNEILREDFRAFLRQVFETLHPGEDYMQTWHIDLLCGKLARQRQGKRLRKIINLPPRSLKSIIVSVALPAWLMGHDPAVKIIVVSYADDLARKFSRDFRTIVTADWYRELFPAMKLGKNTETEIATTQGGYRIAASTGGVLTGRGANLIILDDPIKPQDAESEVARPKNNHWFDKTLFARLDSKQHGSIILVMQRLHQNDLSGHLIEKGGFDLIALPARAISDERWRLPDGRIHRRKAGQALHPERESLEVLAEIEASQGSRVFQAQYQQAPVPAEGNLFKAAWIRYGDHPPLDQMEIVQSWDTATGIGAKNDRSVGTTWGIKDKIYITCSRCMSAAGSFRSSPGKWSRGPNCTKPARF